MPLQNLRENHLYELLPEALVELDEQGLIEAVLGGVQDRVDDLRSYARKLGFFYAATGLPDGEFNVVLATYQSAAGVLVTHSLDFTEDTPPNGSPRLVTWAASQTGIDEDRIESAVYGKDLLRLVDTNTLDYLAGTLGAILYQSAMLDSAADVTAAHRRLVETYFPRLKFKGTAMSFEALGRALGFDDVTFTPLWSRVSPRRPEDIGNPDNDPDFSAFPDFEPQQNLGPFYDPLLADDGPFYTWTSTVSNGTAQTGFYTQAVNGYSPFIRVALTGTVSNGTATHPEPGTYLLSGGAPHTKATVSPAGSSFTFSALVEGDSFNGMPLVVQASGTDRVLSVTYRLSSIKYRASYFDLSMTADMDRIEQLFGSTVARPNTDLQEGRNTPDGTAVSPYRPWVSGSIEVPLESTDWVTRIAADNGTTVVVPRHQATTERQLNFGPVEDAASQVTQAMEEVRPATRIPRKASAGLLLTDNVCYAPYDRSDLLFVATYGTSEYSGSSSQEPLPSYVAAVQLYSGTNGVTMSASSSPANGNVWTYAYDAGAWGATGTYDFDTGIYAFSFSGSYGPMSVVARWTLRSTETIRPEPSDAEKLAGNIDCQKRPEDADDSTEFTDEVVDEYVWRREPTGGGEEVDLSSYAPILPAAFLTPVEDVTVFRDQTGAELDVYAVATESGHPRLLIQDRPTDSAYAPGKTAIAYSGTLRDLSTITPQEQEMFNGKTCLETYFQPGAKLYHAGLVQGVLVADPVKFNGPHHRDGLTGWYPFAENAADALEVLDHAANNAPATLTGVSHSDRRWDDALGWNLRMPVGSSLASATDRKALDEASLAFWINSETATGTGLLATLGPVELELDGPAKVVYAYVVRSGGGRQLVGSAYLDGWTFVALSKSLTRALFGAGSLSVSAAFGVVDYAYARGEASDTLTIHGHGQQLHDFRIWNRAKTAEELQRVLYHEPTDTPVNYQPGFILTANRRDRYGIEMMPSGWLVPSTLPGYVRNTETALAGFYDGDGSYVGESRRKETGLGGGRALPPVFQLGQQFLVTDGGTSVHATDFGAMPGINEPWLENAAAGTYSVASPGSFIQQEGGWRYRDDGSDQGTAWRQANFDDSGWSASRAPFGFGVGNEETQISFGTDPASKYITTYYRGTFRVDSPSGVTGLTLGLQRGDGAVVYINGNEVVTTNLPGSPNYLSTALVSQTATQIQTFLQFAVSGTSLVVGDNVLAVEVHLSSGSAPRHRFDAYLTGTQQGFATAGTSVPWPANMVETNPCREYVWVGGNDGYVYEVTLSGTEAQTFFSAVKLARQVPLSEVESNPIYRGVSENGTYYRSIPTGSISAVALNGSTAAIVVVDGTTTGTTVVEYTDFMTPEQPTGAEVLLTSSGSCLSVDATGSVPTVVFSPYSGTTVSPNLYLYLNSRVTTNAPEGVGSGSVYDRWTDKGNTAADQGADVSYQPALESNGTLVVPVLGRNGQMEFDNAGQLPVGNYVLEIESGNVGQTDNDFTGFAVEITLDSLVLQKRLLAGRSGFNIRGTDTFDFTLTTATPASWIMSLLWTNAFSDAGAGTRRQLAVYGYRIRRTATELYQVVRSGSLPSAIPLAVQGSSTGTTPGGWVNVLNSYGTLEERAHESVFFPNGNIDVSSPVSDLLTGATVNKLEDVLVLGGDYVLPDEGLPSLPSFGTLTTTGTVSPTWILSGGITDNPSAKISAKLPVDGVVRAVVSTGTNFNDRIYSDYAVAAADNNRTVQLTVDGLSTGSRYFYALEVNGVLSTASPGSFRTAGSGRYSFRFAVGGCENNTLGSPVSNPIWGVAAAGDPDFFLHLGDLHYQNIGYPDPNAFLAMYDTVFAETTHREFFSQVPLVYLWDDHDTGPDGADRTNPAKSAAQSAYRTAIPSHPLPAGDEGPIYRSFRWGRCQFIVTDNRSEMSRVDATDNVNKTVLGDSQKAWFKQEVLKANVDASCKAIFWVQSFSFTGTNYGGDNWQSYQTERRELCDFFFEHDVRRMFILAGDMHAQAVDDGRHSDFKTEASPFGDGGGYPVFQCAPLWQNASQKGTPYLLGPSPASGSALTKRVTFIDVVDGEDDVTVTYTGVDDTGTPLLEYTLTGTQSPRTPGDFACCQFMECILDEGFETAVANVEQAVADAVAAYNALTP